VISAFLGHLTDFGGEHGGAHDGGLDAHGAPSFHFPFFSPLAVATLFTSVGGFGLVAKYGVGLTDWPSLLVAGPASLGTTWAVTYFAYRVVSSSRGSSELRTASFAGALGEVVTPIPEGGVGEVAAVVDGQRFSGPAREAQGRPVARGTLVSVVQLVGSTLVVAARKGDN
jgi:membrane protein implicated in regulation of membrane protease activity